MTAACLDRPPAAPDRLAEIVKCRKSFAYFADTYCLIQAEGDAVS